MEMPFLVSVDWLAEHLQDPNLIIIDSRFSLAEPQLGRQQYQTSHIPGAFYLDLNTDLSSPVQPHGGRHPLPDVDTLAKTFADLGIQSGLADRETTFVVAYDASRFAFASRLWWLLRYLGHDQVAVLDGGFPAWQAAERPVTADEPQPQPKTFIPRVRSHWVKAIAQVESELGQAILVDSREGARYRGEQEPIDPVAGHIPGALNYPWQEVTDEHGFAYPAAHNKQRWSSLPSPQNLTVYCGSGVTACVNLLSLEWAGIHDASLYAGSWSDWCSYAHTPKAQGDEP